MLQELLLLLCTTEGYAVEVLSTLLTSNSVPSAARFLLYAVFQKDPDLAQSWLRGAASRPWASGSFGTVNADFGRCSSAAAQHSAHK